MVHDPGCCFFLRSSVRYFNIFINVTLFFFFGSSSFTPRLYDQGAGPSRIGDYVRHWWRWAQAGVSLKIETSVLAAFEMSRSPTSTTRYHNAYDPNSDSLEGTLVLKVKVQKKRIARSAPTSFFISMSCATVCSYNSHMIEPDFNSQFKL